eukprot:SAG11_NODE_2188_length_3709_cov_6.287812_3_plen_175_part_00
MEPSTEPVVTQDTIAEPADEPDADEENGQDEQADDASDGASDGQPEKQPGSASTETSKESVDVVAEAGMPPQEEVEEPTDTSTVTAETAPHVRTFNGAMAEPMSRETYEAIAKTLDGQVLDIDTLKASKASALSTFKSSAPGPEKEQAAKVFDANSAALLTFMTFSKAAESGQR